MRRYRALPGHADIRIAAELVRLIVNRSAAIKLSAARAIIGECAAARQRGLGHLVPNGIEAQAYAYLNGAPMAVQLM